MNSLSKNTLIASAVATALGSASAFAVPPGTSPGANVYYAGGGSAQANAFFVAACKLFGNQMDLYVDAADISANGGANTLPTKVYVAYGQNTSLGGIGANVPVLYLYKFNGGSFANGIAPQKASGPTQLGYTTVASIQAAQPIAGTTPGTSCTTGLPTYSYTPALTNNQSPDFGLTDVEVPVFSGYNNPTGNAGGTAANSNGGPAPSVGVADGIYDNLFGVAVTDNVYTGAGASSGSLKTNFTRAEVAGILEGSISDFSQLYDDNGAAMPAGGIIFLDRGEGSGTKASGNEYFLGYPGDGASAQLPFSAGNAYTGSTACTTSGTTVTCINQGTADIAEGSTNALISDLKELNKAGKRAIAILGLENPPGKNQFNGANQYDFTKINGVAVDTGGTNDNINGTGATSYINVVKGNYDFYYQNSFNTRTTLSGQPATNAAAFKAQMTAVSFVGANAGTGFPSALPGTLLDADKTSSLAKGVPLNSREKVSTGPLQPVFDARSGSIPASSDPLH